ncbi:MAG: hypothetical protein KAX72_07655, partial [Chitinophagales bacterium]|nr:hypothetical protein [Chitinophagales bacterium]
MNIIFLYVGIFIMLISGCGNINQIKVTSNKWVNELPLKNDVSTKDLKWNLEKIPATNTELESYFNMFDLGFIRFISVNKKMNTAVISGDENRYYIIDLTSNKVIYKYSTQSKIVNCFFDEINNEVIVVDGLRQIYRTSLNSNVTSFENEGRYSGVFFYSDTGFLSYKLIPNSIVENKTGKIVYELVVPKVDKEVIHACKEKGTFSPNNSYFAYTGSRMRKLPGRNQVQSYDVINIWSIKNKRFLAELDLNEFRGVHNELRQITFTTDESRLITSYASGEMYIHNLNHSTVKSKKIQFKSFISGFAISPNDKYAYVIEDHDAAWSINLENGTQTKVAKLPEAFSSVPAFINNDEVVIGSQNSSIFKHNLKYNKVTRIGGSINLIYTISKNAKTLVTYNKETSRLCVFNNESFDKLWCNVSLPNAHIKISPDGSRFAIANQNDFIIYDSSSSEYTHKETLTNTGFPNVFAFNNAGTKLIFGSQPIRIYDISSKNYIYDNSLLKIGCGLRTFINVVALSNKDILAFSCLENNTDRYKIYTLDLTEGSSQLQINRVRVESSAILEFDFEGSKLIAAGNAVVYGGTALCLIDFNKAISECSKGIGISGDKTPYISATAFNSNNNIITAGYKTNLISYSLDVSSKSGNNLLKEGISNYYRSATSIGLNSHNVAFVAADNGVHAINLKNGENLYSLYVNQHSDIFAYNSFGYFYTSNVEYNDLTLKINNKSIDLRLFWDVFYRPDLIKQAQTN